jgi:hypothetical protein
MLVQVVVMPFLLVYVCPVADDGDRINRFINPIKQEKMGLYKKGILGYFRGKVGTVVGAVFNGIHYLRSLPDFGDDNPSEAQLNARLKMALVGGWLKKFKVQLRVGYQSFNKGTTPFAAAMGYHLKNAVTGVAPLYTIDYTKVIISVGELDKINSPVMATTEDAQLDFSWSANGSMQLGAASDKLTFMVYNPAKTEFVFSTGVAVRSALSYDMLLPTMWSGDLVYVWLSVVTASGKLVSDSQYLGSTTVQ